MELIKLLFEIVVVILLTDLFTGTIHWMEDTYGNPDSKYKWITENIVNPNLEHHKYPRKMLEKTFFRRVRLSFQIAVVLGIFFYLFEILNWKSILFLIYAFLTNEIHSWAHKTEKENGKIITVLQKTGIIQSRKMHGIHHSHPFEINYCILTNYLNPILEYLNFWRKLEAFLRIFGIKPTRGNPNRIDTKL